MIVDVAPKDASVNIPGGKIKFWLAGAAAATKEMRRSSKQVAANQPRLKPAKEAKKKSGLPLRNHQAEREAEVQRMPPAAARRLPPLPNKCD